MASRLRAVVCFDPRNEQATTSQLNAFTYFLSCISYNIVLSFNAHRCRLPVFSPASTFQQEAVGVYKGYFFPTSVAQKSVAVQQTTNL